MIEAEHRRPDPTHVLPLAGPVGAGRKLPIVVAGVGRHGHAPLLEIVDAESFVRRRLGLG